MQNKVHKRSTAQERKILLLGNASCLKSWFIFSNNGYTGHPRSHQF